jgi:putative transposase
VRTMCHVMGARPSAYYAWVKRPRRLISAGTLHLHRRAKALFNDSRQSLSSRELMKKLREEGFQVGRFKVRRLMKTLGLVIMQRLAYKVTTKRKLSDKVAPNLLNQDLNPVGKDDVWAGDVTYLKTAEGWMYLAIVMDLYSWLILGWHIDKRMMTDLISKALMKANNLRQPPKGSGIRASMGDVGACWDNAFVERFFGSLEHDWIFKVPSLHESI